MHREKLHMPLPTCWHVGPVSHLVTWFLCRTWLPGLCQMWHDDHGLMFELATKSDCETLFEVLAVK